MKEICIENKTFERLQRHAKPLVDTPDTVLNRALDTLERLEGTKDSSGQLDDKERRIDYRRLPNLKHTKVLDAAIDGNDIARPNWNLLRNYMLILAMKSLTDMKEVHQICLVNMVTGRKEDEGYSYLEEINISVQGQDANAACCSVVTAARRLGVSVEIGFMWRPKEDAVHPGVRARLVVSESASDR